MIVWVSSLAIFFVHHVKDDKEDKHDKEHVNIERRPVIKTSIRRIKKNKTHNHVKLKIESRESDLDVVKRKI